MRGRRRLVVSLLALGASAAGLWLATRLVWLRVEYVGGLRGPVTVSVTGARLRPELGAIALVALAAAAGVVATSGWARRVVGGLVALAGGWAVWLSWMSWMSWMSTAVPAAERPAGAAAPSTLDAVPTGHSVHTAAALLGVGAGLLLLAAGVSVAMWAVAMPRLGARYGAPGTARRAPDPATRWWTAMDAGEDPTLAPPIDPGV